MKISDLDTLHTRRTKELRVEQAGGVQWLTCQACTAQVQRHQPTTFQNDTLLPGFCSGTCAVTKLRNRAAKFRDPSCSNGSGWGRVKVELWYRTAVSDLQVMKPVPDLIS